MRDFTAINVVVQGLIAVSPHFVDTVRMKFVNLTLLGSGSAVGFRPEKYLPSTAVLTFGKAWSIIMLRFMHHEKFVSTAACFGYSSWLRACCVSFSVPKNLAPF